jgi:hypothetical protein
VTAYYFGCIDTPGHFLWTPALRRVFYDAIPQSWPFGPGGGKLDAGYATGPLPKCGFGPTFEIQSRAKLSHIKGWTVLAIWDRTVDTRPGSNSNFVAKGELDFAQIAALATQHFPTIWKRINDAAPITLEKRNAG